MVDVETQTEFIEDESKSKVLKTPEYNLRAIKKYQEKHKEELREKARIRYKR